MKHTAQTIEDGSAISQYLEVMAKQSNKPLLVHIVACTKDYVIGVENKLPWEGKWKSDMKMFRQLTTGYPIVMGKNTMLSLPAKLKDRPAALYSRTATEVTDSRVDSIVSSIEECREWGRKNNSKIVFIIGGGKIYEETLKGVDVVIMNRQSSSLIDDNVEGRVYYPYNSLYRHFRNIISVRREDVSIGYYYTEGFVRDGLK